MYLITGCAGFIGFHMCQYLLKKKLNVIGIDSINEYYSKKLKLNRLKLLKKKKHLNLIILIYVKKKN
jgi:UDP-glucuronate 4-epimerase